MRKRTILALLTLVFVSAVMANPVDPQRAIEVAQQFVPKSTTAQRAPMRGSQSEPSSSIVYTHMMPNSDRPAFYIVNVDGGAFVLVSADDIAHQILGYSLSKKWPVSKDGTIELPAHIISFFDDLAAQIEAATSAAPNQTPDSDWTDSRSRAPMRSQSNLPDSVGPLLTTTWNQGQYYNALCPEDDNGPDGHVYTGCVATAMAQIIKYWSDSTPGRGTHSYSTNYGTLTVNYSEASYDYSSMPNELDENSTQAQINAVAQLIYHCGVATNMQYGAYQSSSFDRDARAGLINFYHFSPNLSYAEKAFFTDTDWNDLMHQEIAANRPVLYSGFGDSGGHTFVCDGYKADNYYHFNFGWGGFCDGWYLTSAVNPNDLTYNSTQTALVGIAPDASCNVILGQVTGNSTFTVNEPLEFYNLMGHNAYEGSNYNNPCNNTITFIPSDNSNQMVADIMEFEDQLVSIYNGSNTNNLLRSLTGGGENNLSPIVSTENALTICYTGNMYYAGFKLSISQDNGYRMVSSIVSSVEATTTHFTWTENGNATQWQIEYGPTGFVLGNGVVENVNTNTVTINNLLKFTQYDFYIRSAGDNSIYGPWNKVTLMIEAPYWQDVVVSKPAGYIYDPIKRRVEISSAEGLAWWAANGCVDDAYLVADIDLSEYKWRPTLLNSGINGQGHVISNVYIRETTSDVGLFSDCSPGTIIENLGLKNAYVKSSSYRVGGLCGTFRGIMRNCYVSNTSVDGADYTGGLIGESDYGTVVNCYVNANVIGNRWTGLMIGNSWEGTNRNCYAAGTLRHRSYCYNAGIAAYAGAGEITNCYSVETEMGCVGYMGSTHIADTSTFILSDVDCILMTPVEFDGQQETTLISALNRWLELNNDSVYSLWCSDTSNTNGGYPIFGNKYVVQCPNVTDVLVKNVHIDENNAVVASWIENGNASQWLIRYRRHDLPDSDYTYVPTSNNPATIQGIPLGYVYDFNVRAIDSENKSGWSETKTLIVDLLYWTDVVATKPAGFVICDDGNVEISSAEGLAWLSATVNGANGLKRNTYEGKTVSLASDIDLEGYRWAPIGKYIIDEIEYAMFSGVFDGRDHIISNIYVNDEYSNLGLFGYVKGASIRNVNIVGGTISSIYTDYKDCQSLHSSAIGGLIGYGIDSYEINNCHSSATIFANGGAGSLCGVIRGDKNQTIVSNCSASGAVYGRESCGGLIGDVYGDVEVRNCFATGNVEISVSNENSWYRGGLIGNFMYASVYNCYSTGTVELDNQSGNVGNVIGCPYQNTHIHYVYGQDNINAELGLIGHYCEDIADTARFSHNGVNNNLLSSVKINNVAYTDLLEALNAWVSIQNDQNLKTWIIDENTGYPVFGDFFEPSCYNPTGLIISQATTTDDTIIRTKLEWSQIGTPDGWEVLFVASQHTMNEGTIVAVNSNPCTLIDLPIGQPLDFYVRAVSDNDSSNWSRPITYIPDKLRWTEVVTSQPSGYLEDSNGNVFISTPEALAWLISVVNGLNGMPGNKMNGKTIWITRDLDMSSYRWTPIGIWPNFISECSIDGNGHTVKGLYGNELQDYMGLLGYYVGGKITNLTLYQCNMSGLSYVGGLVGRAQYVTIQNCAVSGTVKGTDYVGGVTGLHGGSCINNSYAIGDFYTRQEYKQINTYGGYLGGICGSPFKDKIMNCYIVAEIGDTTSCTGIMTGTGGGPDLVSNCYYKYYETTNPVTSDNCNTANNSSFTGSDTNWILESQSFIGESFYNNLIDALNAWVDANNKEGEYRHWESDTANVNGGYPIFAPLPKFIVEFKNANGDTLQIDTLVYGSVPEYRGATPSLESTTQYAYTFREWSATFAPVTQDVIFTALYDSHMFGDVTDNASVDVQDATIVVNYILGERSDNYLYHMADMNNDTEIDVFDLTAIINVILGRTSFQAPMRTGSSGYETTAYLFGNESTNIVGEEDIYLRHVSDKIGLSIANASRFTSFQMDVEVPEGAELQNVELTGSKNTHFVQKAKIGDNLYRVIALSMSSQPLADSIGELVTFQIPNASNAEISVSNVMFVTPKGEAHYFNGASTMTPTIVRENTTDKDDVIFDLSGRRIYKKPEDLERGVYIINNEKVIIK